MILVLLAGIAGIAIVAYFGLRGGKKQQAVVTRDAAPKAPAVSAGTSPETAQTPTAPGSAPAAPRADQLATTLEAGLRKQRLWSTVAVVGNHADVRSASCSDPAMGAALDRVAASFKTAGLTKLRCLEQSGRVVLSRDL